MKNKFKEILKTLGLTVVMVVLSCVMAFADDGGATIDAVSILSESASTVVQTLLGVLAAVVTAGLGFFTVKLGISYGIKFLKQILGKMS